MSPAGEAHPPGAVSATVRLTALAVLAALPLFLLSGLAVPMRDSLALGTTQIGVAYALYFAVSAALSPPCGRVVARIGARWGATSLVIGVTLCLLGQSLAPSVALLVALTGVAGLANALLQPIVSVEVAALGGARRAPLVVGVVMGGVPLAALLAGLAGQWLAVTVEGAHVFAGAAAASIAIGAGVILRTPAPERPRRPSRHGEGILRPPRRTAPILIGAFAGAVGGNSLPAFVSTTADEHGTSHAALVVLLPVAVGASITVRILTGLLLGRHPALLSRVFGVLLAVGALGLLGLGFPETFLPGLVLAYGAGWGWVGVANSYAAMRHPLDAPIVTAWVQVAVFSGSAIGPLVLGALAGGGLWTAWLFAAAVAAVGALVLLLSGSPAAQAS